MFDIDNDVVLRKVEAGDFDELIQDLVKEIEIRNYSVTRINNIDNIHKRIKEEDSKQKVSFRFYKIVEFCNLGSCAELISSQLLAGLFMPARFIVFQPKSESTISMAFLKPTAFAENFNSSALMTVARRMERDMTDVLEEFAL